MYATANSTIVWKRKADESQQSARTMARVSVGLLVLLMVTAAYAYATQARYDDLCRTIQLSTTSAAATPNSAAGMSIASNFCI